jgi:hypothetical protein
MRACDDPTVYLAAAKESGDVDYASAAVVYLDVDEDLQPDDGAGRSRIARIAVAKSRHGETGFVGARFYGAPGRWVADVGAAAQMSTDGRTGRKIDKQLNEDDEKLIAAVRRHPSKSWRELRPMVGIGSWSRADDARRRLLAAETLELVTERFIDGRGRTQKRDVLRVVGDAPPAKDDLIAPASMTPTDPAIAKFIPASRFG